MEELKIEIGDNMFFAQLSEYRMTDWTFQVEARITKVSIDWVYKFKDEPTKYMFDIWPANLSSTEDRLFRMEDEAKKYLENKISIIPIIVNLQEELECETEWPVQLEPVSPF